VSTQNVLTRLTTLLVMLGSTFFQLAIAQPPPNGTPPTSSSVPSQATAPAVSPPVITVQTSTIDQLLKTADDVLKADDQAVKTIKEIYELAAKLLIAILVILGAVGGFVGVRTYKDLKERWERAVTKIAALERRGSAAAVRLKAEIEHVEGLRSKMETEIQYVERFITDVSLLAVKADDIDRNMAKLVEAQPGGKKKEKIEDLETEILADLDEAAQLSVSLRLDRMISWVAARRGYLYMTTRQWGEAISLARDSVKINPGNKPDRPYNLACAYALAAADTGTSVEAKVARGRYEREALVAIEQTLILAGKATDGGASVKHWKHEIANDEDLAAIHGPLLDALLAKFP
jgi:hypothetical protein